MNSEDMDLVEVSHFDYLGQLFTVATWQENDGTYSAQIASKQKGNLGEICGYADPIATVVAASEWIAGHCSSIAAMDEKPRG